MPRRPRSRWRDRPRVALFYLEANLLSPRGVARYIREHGPWALYLYSTGTQESLPQWLAKWKGDGIIGRVVDRKSRTLIKRLGMPFVDIRGEFRDPRIPLVQVDNHAIGRTAAEHLLDRGFQQFGYYGLSRGINSHVRKQTFMENVTRAGGRCLIYDKPPGPLIGPEAWDRAEQGLAEWLMQLPKPAAVLAEDNGHGQAVLAAARRVGIPVPDELAVLGVGHESTICELCDPPLSCVVRDFETQGYEAAALLDRIMAGEDVPVEPVLIPPAGIQTRQSTDVLAIDDRFVAKAVSFIRRHACDGIGVQDVLREVPLSRTVLQERFHRVLGQTIGDTIIGTRIKRAQQLLAETDMPLVRIAQVAGFGHQQYLGAVFRKRVGTTPGQYRTQSRRSH